MANDIEVVRDLKEILESFSAVKKEMASTQRDLASVNRALKLDSGNVELLAKRSELLATQLKENKDKSKLLGEAITELNRIKEESGKLDATQEKQLASLTYQQKDAENQVIGLTAKIKEQSAASRDAAESTKTFSQSMTEFQSNLSAMKQVISGVDNAFKLFGGDPDSTMGKAIKQSQQAVNAFAGLASMAKLLTAQNGLLSNSFLGVSAAAGGAFLIGSGVYSMLKDLDGTARVVTGTVLALAGGITALTIALAVNKAFTNPLALAGMAAAAGVAVAGINLLTKAANEENNALTQSNIESASMPTASTPSVPSMPTVPTRASGGSSGTSQTIVNTLSEKQVENAAFNGVVRAILETGINEPKLIERVTVTRGEIVRDLVSGGNAVVITGTNGISGIAFDPKVR